MKIEKKDTFHFHALSSIVKWEASIMAETTNLNIKIDRELKSKADKLFNDMGISFTTAVNVFVRQAVFERAIPFKISRSTENIEPKISIDKKRAAMQEIRDLLAGIDGNIDLEQTRAERRAAKYECND